MKIHLHDGSGHPFQVQLSRALARRGHDVLHTYATQWVSGHGRLEVTEDDPSAFDVRGITARRPFVKYSPGARMAWELSYAKAWRDVLKAHAPDVMVSCNTQLITAGAMLPYLTWSRLPWVLWHQDIASLAVADEVARKLPGSAAAVGARAVVGVERALVRRSAAIVAIGEPFLAQYRDWGIPDEHAQVIPNWAPLDEIAREPRSELWPQTVGIPPAPLRLLYAGTLGRKHNPLLLVDLVRRLNDRGTPAQLVVASEGEGVDAIMDVVAGTPADDFVRVVGFQPAASLTAMFASADVLCALLEPEASRFSIPSKVLSYLAAGRPILALAPATNPCVADIEAGGGMVANPDSAGVQTAVTWVAELDSQPDRVVRIGQSARNHAEANFDIDGIADKFERVLSSVGRDAA